MQLVCPACAARYRLPEGAIGRSGREVSCSACGHRWYAAPAAGPAEPEAPPKPPGWGGQMAEIRQMLDEVQSTGNAAREPEPSAGPYPAEPPAASVAEPDDHSETGFDSRAAAVASSIGAASTADVDPLREKLTQHGSERRGGRKHRRQDDRRSLMRQHGRKVRRRKAREAAGSGAFMTGFLLLVIVVAAMIAIYQLRDRIVAFDERLAGPLDQYVATVKSAHATVASGYDRVREAIADMIEKV